MCNKKTQKNRRDICISYYTFKELEPYGSTIIRKDGNTMTKLSNKQIETLQKLSKRPAHGSHHAKDGCSQRTLDALLARDYVEYYYVPGFLHGGVKITPAGEQALRQVLNLSEEQRTI